MISFILSLLGGLGIPAILTGIAGKLGLSWIAKLTGMDGLIGTIFKPIVALCIGLVDLLLEVLRWALRKIMGGLDHITQSVPATMTLLLFMWVSYGYGHGFGFWKYTAPPVAEMRSSVPTKAPATKRVTYHTPGDWFKDVFGLYR